VGQNPSALLGQNSVLPQLACCRDGEVFSEPLNETRYDIWRDYDPEDSVRFYALRLNEAGIVKSSPQKLIVEHTDWRFLSELKREMKT
jgi:NitT/TauT family transport system substrate-binding protein